MDVQIARLPGLARPDLQADRSHQEGHNAPLIQGSSNA